MNLAQKILLAPLFTVTFTFPDKGCSQILGAHIQKEPSLKYGKDRNTNIDHTQLPNPDRLAFAWFSWQKIIMSVEDIKKIQSRGALIDWSRAVSKRRWGQPKWDESILINLSLAKKEREKETAVTTWIFTMLLALQNANRDCVLLGLSVMLYGAYRKQTTRSWSFQLHKELQSN